MCEKCEAIEGIEALSGFNPHDREGHYILDGYNVVEERDLYKFIDWFGTANRVVKQETIGGRYNVSTVFLGLDHDHGRNRDEKLPGYQPLVFETMVFHTEEEPIEIGGRTMMVHEEVDNYQERCRTWDEAVVLHADAVAWARGRCNDMEQLERMAGDAQSS